MSAGGTTVENLDSARVPRFLIELPSRTSVFLDNLRDEIYSPRTAPLELASTPGDFWPDVFVARPLPWKRFLQSAVYHVVGGAIVIGLSHLFALQPRVVRQLAKFDRSQVVYYQASEYLPPLDTRAASSVRPRKADPEPAPQPIISVPPESDNRSQTIVAPPRIKLKRDIAMPNTVNWSAQQKPQLEIPSAPVIPAAEIARLAPSVESSVVAPPPDAFRIQHRRSGPALQSSVVAPAPELRASSPHAVIQGLQPALIAPAPSVENASAWRVGDINIGASSVIAPAPQLPVAEQRMLSGGSLSAAIAPQVVPPPPSLSTTMSAGASSGSGRVTALSLHPAVARPLDPPNGNRRGTFASAPEGHAGASGSPGGTGTTKESADAKGTKGNGEAGSRSADNLPTGLYVGKPAAKPEAVAGSSANNPAATSVNPNLLASVHPPRVTTSRPMEPDNAAKLSVPERAVFAGRKFYSVTLNMPNLNSGGGSWVIRFAELNHDSSSGVSNASPDDLSQPMATRKVDPAYPLQLMRENVHGTVILYALIHPDGSVSNVRVLQGVDERLDRFASEAVAQWKFDPATKNGQPIGVEATFQIPFRPTRIGTGF